MRLYNPIDIKSRKKMWHVLRYIVLRNIWGVSISILWEWKASSVLLSNYEMVICVLQSSTLFNTLWTTLATHSQSMHLRQAGDVVLQREAHTALYLVIYLTVLHNADSKSLKEIKFLEISLFYISPCIIEFYSTFLLFLPFFHPSGDITSSSKLTNIIELYGTS